MLLEGWVFMRFTALIAIPRLRQRLSMNNSVHSSFAAPQGPEAPYYYKVMGILVYWLARCIYLN